MVKILEACLVQAYSGNLQVDDYFTSLYEANLKSPYDPDFDSEAYYEHENRLQVDDGYAEAESRRKQRVAKDPAQNTSFLDQFLDKDAARLSREAFLVFGIGRQGSGTVCPPTKNLFWRHQSP